MALALSPSCTLRLSTPPRGNAYQGLQEYQTAVEMGKSEVLHSGCKVAVLALGSMVEICADVCSELQKAGIDPTFVNVRFVKPLDTALLDQLARNHSLVVTVEEIEVSEE